MTDDQATTFNALPPNGRAVTVSQIRRITGQAPARITSNLIYLEEHNQVERYIGSWKRAQRKPLRDGGMA